MPPRSRVSLSASCNTFEYADTIPPTNQEHSLALDISMLRGGEAASPILSNPQSKSLDQEIDAS